MAVSLEETLIDLTSHDQWEDILNLEPNYPLEEKSKFLWAWPSLSCLYSIKAILQENGISSILSIGCGSGLLEWIINKSTGIQVAGLELDHTWWSSVYSPKTFIDLKFIDSAISPEFLCKCMKDTNPEDFALLFCYFNNRTAFLEYMRAFKGSMVIIIGPQEGAGIVTDPVPLNPEFEESGCEQWRLVLAMKMQTPNNCVAIYKRCFQ